MLQIDSTIHLSDLIIFGGGLITIVRLFLSQRDINRDVLRLLRGERGDNGLVADVKQLRGDMYENDGIIAKILRTLTGIKGGRRNYDPAVEADEREH